MNWLKQYWLWTLINTAALIQCVAMVASDVAAGFTGRAAQHIVGGSGSAAMLFLVLSLAMTPVQIVTGWRRAATLKKSTGLWAFGFSALHLLAFLTSQFDLAARIGTLAATASIAFGALALVMMLALALTSTRSWMRRLGPWWKRLHRTVYAAGVLVVLHVALLSGGQGIVFGVAMMALLAVRLPPVKRWFVQRQQRRAALRRPAQGTLQPRA